MAVAFHIAQFLEDHFQKVASSLEGFGDGFTADVRPTEPRFGVFQANGVLPYAKKTKQNPRALAQTLLDALQLPTDHFTAEIAGPGFININLTPAFYADWLKTFKDEAALQQGASHIDEGLNVVVDYSSPNTAKQMHVGHLRSMVIGEAIQRLLRFCGANVTRDNHIGDWGTQFGILIMAIKDAGYNLDEEHPNLLEELEALYKAGTQKTKDDPAALEQARNELVKLQQGDAENMQLWEKINSLSYEAFESIYKLFNVAFDCVLGESFYRDKVDRIYKELEETKLSEESQGALVVFHPEHPRFAKQPFIIRKSDGATNYATTDLATALHRLEAFEANEMINVTDGRQQDHFEQLRLTVEKWFAAKGYKPCKLRHVWFGTILGEDGKAIKTRSGEPIKLKELVSEAVERAYKVVAEKSPELTEDEKREIAEKVGIGAVRYADLSQNRTSDYTFSWEKMLSFDGNTAPYLLYATARLHAIFRKAGLKPGEGEDAATSFETETELALARKLVLFPSVLELTLEDLRPHFLCTYLFELSGIFSSFYNADKVVTEDPGTQARRLMLCARTLNTLETGLKLLGIETLERM
tara:strand:+ start:6303 stop:8054 length:1752 start_codon:yes stop_codon:yes gene_type:complete